MQLTDNSSSDFFMKNVQVNDHNNYLLQFHTEYFTVITFLVYCTVSLLPLRINALFQTCLVLLKNILWKTELILSKLSSFCIQLNTSLLLSKTQKLNPWGKKTGILVCYWHCWLLPAERAGLGVQTLVIVHWLIHVESIGSFSWTLAHSAESIGSCKIRA